MNMITEYYRLPLLLLSIFIACAASYAALDLGIRIDKTKGRLRYLWLWGGAFTMGMGIWSMQVAHYPTIQEKPLLKKQMKLYT
ncbi:hypothetical protein M1K46_02195 [Fictibacillus sp. WQ 8-8]|uniref:hypothetical protein n=1 Tax=Fictibacillus sp. WQ 8-8 TaxID=2938788 RepID=UPI00210ADEF8|nr:hypothetical protein [Fictibacillus sp. WQ 8-8]MCQ6264477.1 hypothetical protein [Fictibacillus sp. WQ 8-8]